MESDPRWGYPGGASSSPNTWHRPTYRGGGGGGYRGNGGGSGGPYTPRQNWRGQSRGQWTPSPYRGYRPNHRGSPYQRHSSPGYDYQPRPFRHRNPHSSPRPRFQSTPYSQNKNDIEAWVSPQMWEDPWARLLGLPKITIGNFSISIGNSDDSIEQEDSDEIQELPWSGPAKDIIAAAGLEPEIETLGEVETNVWEYLTTLKGAVDLKIDSELPSSNDTKEIPEVEEPDIVDVDTKITAPVEPESTAEEMQTEQP